MSNIVKMSISDLLKDLPSYNSENFSLFNTEGGIRATSKRPSVYIPTKDFPSEQVIISDKTNILLHYLHVHWDKSAKVVPKKREVSDSTDEAGGNARKRPRLDTEQDPATGPGPSGTV